MTESEQRYRQLIRTSPAPINLFDASGEIIWGNDAVVDLLAIDSRDQLIGRSIFEFIHPDDRYTAAEELTAVVEEKRATGPTTMNLERDDGEVRTIQVATAPGRYRGRDIGQAVVVDVTELEQMQAELERERDFVEKALDVLDDVFYVIDTAGTLVRWNDALLDVSGYSADEVRRMEVEEFFVDDDVDRVSASIARAFADGADTVEATVLTKRGETIPFEFRKRRLTRDGETCGLVGVGRDVSAQKTREQHLRTVDVLLQHQLRNQLNVVQGRAAVLREQLSDPDDEHFDELYAATERMLDTFDHHRYIITQLTERPEREHVDVVAVLDDAVAECREEHPGAAFVLHVPDEAMVVASPAIEYALRELFRNAIEHARADRPEVEITVTGDGSRVRIEVVDAGPPIPEMEYSFLAGPDALESTYHPSGLGLWSVYLAVTQSHGSVTVDRTADAGNAVAIELPTPPRDWE